MLFSTHFKNSTISSKKNLKNWVKRLNKQTLMAIAYAQNALSFVFLDSGINDYITAVYLYGSAVRNELSEESDIDIFIDCKDGKEKILEGMTKAAISRFFKSNDFEKWKLYKFTYPISIQAGDIATWQLKTSIMAEGILLYSKKTEILPAERKVIITYKLPRDKKKYLHFVRCLFGRKEKWYKDQGLLGEIIGKKISSNTIIIPKENQQKIIDFMNKNKITYSIKEICVFE